VGEGSESRFCVGFVFWGGGGGRGGGEINIIYRRGGGVSPKKIFESRGERDFKGGEKPPPPPLPNETPVL